MITNKTRLELFSQEFGSGGRGVHSGYMVSGQEIMPVFEFVVS